MSVICTFPIDTMSDKRRGELVLFNSVLDAMEHPQYDKIISIYCVNCSMIRPPPRWPKKLKVLVCSENKLSFLGFLPKTLEVLTCRNNYITEIPYLPNLKHLNCSFNRISRLVLPEFLFELKCSNNLLKELIIPKYLVRLSCHRNLKLKLSNFPESLKFLQCSEYQISSPVNIPIVSFL